ncbi:hypothetical protein LWI29_036130 [Acer saccharum]|uniref:Uncharacterized protein n=1 Tax=Acer saccharum TaxID=4024 RepID=A0AA39TJW0_ACESA|nr:hypothetical protein LWI29_036130 [Acer saccharum]
MSFGDDYLHSATHQQLRNGTTMQRRHRHMRNYALNNLGSLPDLNTRQLFEKHRPNYEDPQVLWAELLEFRKAYVDCYSAMCFGDDYLHSATHQQLRNGTTMQRRHWHMRNYALNTLGMVSSGQCSLNLPLLFTFADEYGSTDTAKKLLDRSLPDLNTRQLFEKHRSNYEDPQVLWAELLEFRKAYVDCYSSMSFDDDYLHSATHQQLRNGTTMQRRHWHMRNYALNTLGTVSLGQCSPNLPLLFTFADEYGSTDTAKKWLDRSLPDLNTLQLFEKHGSNYEDPQVLWAELLEFRKPT